MTDPTSIPDLLALIRSERQRFDALLRDLSPAQMVEPSLHGGWSVKDTLAHIAAWEQEFLGWYRAGLRGEIPEPPDPNNIDPYNQQLYERHRARALDDVRVWSEASYQEVLATVEAMSEDDIFTVGRYAWTGEDPLLPYLRSNTDEHYAEHAVEIARWRGR